MDYESLFDNQEVIQTCEPGETVFAEGEVADAVYFVLDGKVEVQRHGTAMSVEGAGSIIGESALLASATHRGAAVARSAARLARLERAQLKELMNANADFALHVMAALALRLRSVDAEIGSRTNSGADAPEA